MIRPVRFPPLREQSPVVPPPSGLLDVHWQAAAERAGKRSKTHTSPERFANDKKSPGSV